MMQVKYLVTKQSAVYHCDVKHCVTRDNIPVVVRATVVLRVRGNADEGEDPDLVRKFVHGLGVRGLETQLANAVEEGIRVMARDTLHQAVYALTSGGGVTRRRPRPAPPLPPPLKRTSTELTGESESAVAVDPLNCSTVKRNQVAPSPDASGAKKTAILSSPSQAQAAPFVDGTVEAVDGECVAATPSTVAARPASASVDGAAARTQPAPLPTIQRGLRASRIVPAEVADALTKALKSSTPTGEGSSERSAASATIASVLRNPARIYPEQGQDGLHQGAGETRSREGLGGGGGGSGGGGVGGVLGTPLRSRSPPAVTNLDLSPSPSLSDSSSLPKLGLEITQPLSVPGFPATPASPAGDISDMEGGRGSGDIEQADGATGFREGNGAARHRDTPGAAAAEEEAAAAAAAAVSLEKNIALGRRHAEQLRDRLNRTLSPQGVEITTVMIRSLELPPDIADQMSETTLYASLNEEERAAKKSEVQRVKHEEEVLGLRQECEIERALTSREGDEEVVKARLRLLHLRAQANAMVGTIGASASTTELRVASEAQREVSRSCLRETAEHSLGESSSLKVAGVLVAEAEAFRTRRESEAHLEVKE
ncbi:unnamed protein product, partial [Laminaria digitata]